VAAQVIEDREEGHRPILGPAIPEVNRSGPNPGSLMARDDLGDSPIHEVLNDEGPEIREGVAGHG
jgi:hypothetical protein